MYQTVYRYFTTQECLHRLEISQVFMKTNEWLKEKITRRSSKLLDKAKIRRALETRFRISHTKRREFFETIFHNMTNDYRSFTNWTAEQVLRSGQDVCEHQTEVKKLWRNILEGSLLTLKKALRHCVDEYLADQEISRNSKLGLQVNNYLVQEMSSIRTNQLELLCDKFQLCYDDILQEFRLQTYLGTDELTTDDKT